MPSLVFTFHFKIQIAKEAENLHTVEKWLTYTT